MRTLILALACLLVGAVAMAGPVQDRAIALKFPDLVSEPGDVEWAVIWQARPSDAPSDEPVHVRAFRFPRRSAAEAYAAQPHTSGRFTIKAQPRKKWCSNLADSLELWERVGFPDITGAAVSPGVITFTIGTSSGNSLAGTLCTYALALP